MKVIGALVILVMLSTPAMAVVPVSKDIRNVVDYFYNGQSKGPILVDFIPCQEVIVDKKSDQNYECKQRAKGTVKKGTKVTAWTSWFVPEKGLYNDIMIQFAHDGLVRSTKDINLNGGIRKRAFRTITLSKEGPWELRVLKGNKIIAKAKINVTK